MIVLNTKRYKVQCRNCRAELLFTRGDVKEDWLRTDRWIVCPICKKKRHLGALSLYEINDEVDLLRK